MTMYTATEHFPNSFTKSLPVESYWTIMFAGSLNSTGFLRWAYDAWVQDPLRDSTHSSFPAGDCFLVYPSEKDAVNKESKFSLRLAKLDEGVRDINKLYYMKETYPELEKDVEELLHQVNDDYGYTTLAPFDPWGRTAKWIKEDEKGRLLSDIAKVKKGIYDITQKFIALEQAAQAEKVQQVQITEISDDIHVNDKVQLHAVIFPETAVDKTVSWQSDSDIASIDSDGILTARQPGTVTITAISNQNQDIMDQLKLTILNINTADLQAALEKAENLLNDQYTEESKQVLAAAVAAAKSLLNKPNATQEEINDAEKTISLAIDQLEADETILIKSILKTTIDKAEIIIAGDDFKTLAFNVQAMIKTRLNEAIEVYNDKYATLDTCKTAWLNLAEALHYADFKADKTVLKELIDQCEAIHLDQYTEESAKVFTDALAEANKVYKDENALQERINAAYEALSTAKNSLSEKPVIEVDKSTLSYIIDSAKGAISEQDKYIKDAAWDIFVEALANAELIYEADTVTQEEVNSATTDLSNAYSNIRYLPDEEMLKQLEDFINYTKKISRELYHENDLKVIDDTVELAKNMLNKKDFDQEDFDAFTTKMNKVIYIINNNKIEELIDKNQNDNDDKQSNMKTPQTSDPTNAVSYLILLSMATIFMVAVRRKTQ